MGGAPCRPALTPPSPLSTLTAVQQKVSEESVARMRAESKAVEVVKRCSTLELDLKQSLQKMEQLMKQKERLEDEVRRTEGDRRVWEGPGLRPCWTWEPGHVTLY